MMIKTLLTATAAVALLVGGAHAGEGAKKKAKPAEAAATQPKDDMGTKSGMADHKSPSVSSDTAVNPSADTTMAAPAATESGTPASATVAAKGATNGPVADTPENRAKYKPLSKAGRQTAARGN